MTLKSRLALLMAGLIALAVMAQGASGYARYARLSLEDADRQLRDYIRQVAGDALPQTNQPRPPPGSVTLNPTARARIVTGGEVTQTYGEAMPANLSFPPDGYGSSGDWRVVRLRLSSNGRLEGALSLVDVRLGLQSYLASLALTVPILALLGAGLAFLVTVYALAPLEGLVVTLGRVAQSGDLSARVETAQPRTELGRLARAFNQMLAQLEAYREREVSFTRTAAHELRTPLAAMQAQLDAQQNGWVTADEALTSARRQVTRMTRLTHSLLVLSREEQPEFAPLELADLARSLAAQHGATYAGLERLWFTGHALLLERALENLLENAGLHAPNAAVRVTLETAGDTVRLSVIDAGAGLSAAALQRAGEVFYRAPQTQAAGSGLGLSVVKRIAEAHNGKLSLDNIAPHGLKATLELPLTPPTA